MVKTKTIDWDFRTKKLSKKGGDDDEEPSHREKKTKTEPASLGRVKHVKSEDEYNELIKSNPHVFVDFNASWCKPCKKIMPEIIKWSTQPEFEHVSFLSVDVEELDDLGNKLDISQMPTFFFIHKGELVEKMNGSYVEPILSRLKKLAARKD
eukprot:TRINITY_DN1718_c0_g2_i12.p1 TRINITY_DN1718_c0_g2~~TRINITY_DN1718_c0_g2_i12.p1  ORF type:complete len:152 (-),score=26.06 TRINITY_DN1718_c0_g2_i12:230-685(-)